MRYATALNIAPRLLSTDQAITYLGGMIGRETFMQHVAPHCRRIILSPRNFGWLREDLDRYLDHLAGIERKPDILPMPEPNMLEAILPP